ncbi:uncharacterized protein LOC127096223 [Lathyrus oleraceus]|uniref:uncharacterized protein LOC127096223 n=1 Tax=Pisum sativum TaxID=3888 RepID=UPI0021CF88F6|nr:uncharacterized protein LOC127096223 [Pisum sativum]
MVYGFPGSFWIYDIRLLGENLVKKHTRYSKNGFVPPHNYASCRVCSRNSEGCLTVVMDLQAQMDQGYIEAYRDRDYNQVNMVNTDNEVNVIVPQFNDSEPIQITYDSRKTSVTPLVINLPGPVPYLSDKVVPYKYNATMTENGKDVPLPSIINIADVSRVTRSGHIFTKRTEDVAAGKHAHVEIPFESVGQSDNMNPKSDDDEAHREALQKVLEQDYVDYDVTVGQFDGIVANITACNNLSFSSSLNVMPKSTLSKLSFQGAPMRSSGIIVKAFDGSRKTVIGEVNLPMTIGPHTSQMTFQVMDIEAAYSCLLGQPWIHEAGVVTSTLHQKLKFVKNGKLVIVCGEKMLVVSHLSSFSYLEPEEVVGTQFQALSLIDKDVKRGVSISSFKDAQWLVNDGITDGWGRVLDLLEKKTSRGFRIFSYFQEDCRRK